MPLPPDVLDLLRDDGLLDDFERYLHDFEEIHSYGNKDAPLLLSDEQCPVIIFSHGLGGMRNYNTAYCEELASYGYVVVSVDHTYTSWRSTTLDGRRFDFVDPDDEDDGMIERMKRVEENVADVKFVLQKMGELNTSDPMFQGRLNMEKVGMFGHSIGGTVTLEMVRQSDAIRAAVAFDSPLLSRHDKTEIEPSIPFMLFLGGTYEEVFGGAFDTGTFIGADTLCSRVAQRSDAYKIVIESAAHNAFCDQAVIKQILQDQIIKTTEHVEFGVGLIDGFLVTKIVNEYLVAFFNKHLEYGVRSDLPTGTGGDASGFNPLDRGVSPYEEVVFAKYSFV